jgi:hypothetical protein
LKFITVDCEVCACVLACLRVGFTPDDEIVEVLERLGVNGSPHNLEHIRGDAERTSLRRTHECEGLDRAYEIIALRL